MIRISDFESALLPFQGKKLWLACSGGVDSMVLLYLLHALKCDFSVIHVNYQLRGDDSNKDEELVTNTCEALKIPVFVRRIDTHEILSKQGGNLQDVTRKMRYGWFREIFDAGKENLVVLGHHQDDQVETFFQHIARKSGITGMAGMLGNHGRIIRPLLKYPKASIYAFAREKDISWREDVSNEGNKYTRNKLRNVLIPEMEKTFPDIRKSVVTLVEAFQATQKATEEEVKDQVDAIRKDESWSLEDFDRCSGEEKAEILRNLGIRQTFIPELEKLRNAQKGKKTTVDGYEIVRELTGFSFIQLNKTSEAKLSIQKVNVLPAVFDQHAIYLDGNKIKGKLRLRTWETGDRMKPIGLNGSKLISDILTGSKISAAQKKRALIVEDDANILWCVGIKVSVFALADENTTEILVVSVEK